MLFLKKKISIYLYIFFLFLTFFFAEFSTNNTFAKNFVVSKIEVEMKYNLNFNKTEVIDRGFKKAFKDLLKMLLERKDFEKIKTTSIQDIKKLIENFSILDEKFIDKKYKSTFEVEFNKKKLISFLSSKNVILSLPKNIDVFFLPIFIDTKTKSINFINENIFVENWKDIQKNYFQINYILPNEDVEDYFSIKNNLDNIENYSFEEITKKYDSKNYIILIIFRENRTLKFYSKIKFDDKLIIINENIVDRNINIKSELHALILSIKNNYEDKWKSINKLSPSISVPIRLSIDSNNTQKSLKLESILSNLDFVNDFEIEKFNSREVVYKINYSSSPKRFLKEIISYDIEIDTSSPDWKIK